MEGRSEDVVADVQADHGTVLEGLQALSRLEGLRELPQFWDVADHVVRREVAMELVVYPEIETVAGTTTLGTELRHEQDRILTHLFRIEQEDLDEHRFHHEICRLWSSVSDHIGHEEAELVPLILVGFSWEHRLEVGDRYRDVRDVGPLRTERSAPLSKTIVGRLSTMADWIRDSALSIERPEISSTPLGMRATPQEALSA